jgi:hypothetical protein
MKFFFHIGLLIFLTACNGGTTTGNPVKTVNVRMEDKQPFAWIKKLSDSFIPSAYASVSSVTFCFKRMRFKPDSATNGSNFDLTVGEIVVDPNDTNIVTVGVPEGSYRRIEFDLEADCNGDETKPSVKFTNATGLKSTSQNMTIKFEGIFVVSADGTLNLDIDPLLDAMETVPDSNSIKSALEAATGQF